LQGEITIGLYAISPCTQRCKWVAIDADYKNAMEDLLKLQYYLWQDKVEPALEMSKRGAIFGFCWKGRCWQRTAESTFTIWRGGWGCQQRVPAWGRASKYFPGIVRLVKEGLAMPFAALWGFIEGPAAVSGSMGPITRWKRRWLTSTAYANWQKRNCRYSSAAKKRRSRRVSDE